jgi:hypothetical protein
MNKLSFAAALAALLASGAAHAATLDITLGVNTMNQPTITYNYNASQSLPVSNVVISHHTPGLNLVNNDDIIPATDSKTDYWAAPQGITGSDYLAVLGLTKNLQHEDKGVAVFTLAKGDDHLGFTWGTIDDYNTLTIIAGGKKYTVTGADILGALPAGLDPSAGSTQVNVEITDPLGDIKKAIFTSTGNTFELGNISEMDTPAPTPLPPAFLLFGSALAALYLFGQRRLAKA